MKPLTIEEQEKAIARIKGLITSMEMMILQGKPSGTVMSGNIEIHFEIK